MHERILPSGVSLFRSARRDDVSSLEAPREEAFALLFVSTRLARRMIRFARELEPSEGAPRQNGGPIRPSMLRAVAHHEVDRKPERIDDA